MMTALDFHKHTTLHKQSSCDLFDSTMPSKFNEFKMKTARPIKFKLEDTYKKKRKALDREIMINNITQATNRKLALLSEDPLKASNMKRIRQEYPVYRSDAGSPQKLPATYPVKEHFVPFLCHDEMDPVVKFDPSIFT